MREKTAKALGYKKGDFVHTGAFPGILVSDVNSSTPCAEVWGIEHETGSCYARDLRKLTFEQFQEMVRLQDPSLLDIGGSAYSAVAKQAIREAEALVTH